jgi:hypothetical protein
MRDVHVADTCRASAEPQARDGDVAGGDAQDAANFALSLQMRAAAKAVLERIRRRTGLARFRARPA